MKTAVQLADMPPPQSVTLQLHLVNRKLLLIFRPAKSERLSLSIAHTTVRYQFANGPCSKRLIAFILCRTTGLNIL